MENITDVKLSEMKKSDYIHPFRMHYKQDGKEKFWDLLRIHDSVGILLFNTTKKVLIFVKQFRPTVYIERSSYDPKSAIIDTKQNPGGLGVTLELCAGIVDKDKSLAEVAKDEILEECGYDVPLLSIHKVTSYRANVGVSASHQTLFYAEVTADMKVSEGGGKACEGELIDVIEMSVSDAKAMVFDESIEKPVSMLFGLMWFFCEKKSVYDIPDCKDQSNFEKLNC